MSDTPLPASTKAIDPRDKRRPKVPAFARYQGTSVWRSNRRRVREYARFVAAAKLKAASAGA